MNKVWTKTNYFPSCNIRCFRKKCCLFLPQNVSYNFLSRINLLPAIETLKWMAKRVNYLTSFVMFSSTIFFILNNLAFKNKMILHLKTEYWQNLRLDLSRFDFIWFHFEIIERKCQSSDHFERYLLNYFQIIFKILFLNGNYSIFTKVLKRHLYVSLFLIWV